MSKLFVAPILFQYHFLDDLCLEAAKILSIDLSEESKYKQFKLSIFINFNRYLIDSLSFLPASESEKIFKLLTPAMQAADENKTLDILSQNLNFFNELRVDFLNIIKTLKK